MGETRESGAYLVAVLRELLDRAGEALDTYAVESLIEEEERRPIGFAAPPPKRKRKAAKPAAKRSKRKGK
jgi:hypothetical protein